MRGALGNNLRIWIWRTAGAVWGLCGPGCPVLIASPYLGPLVHAALRNKAGPSREHEQGAPAILELQQEGWLLRTPWLSWLQKIL